MSAYCKGEIVMNQSSVKKGLTVKDLVTVGVFSALFLIFALSGGEKQRISIARAMLKDAPIVILDEATAYTDPENEAIIQESVARLVRGKTLIVIAHRLSTIVDADQIIVVNDGHIEATGTQAELLQTCPLYETLWNAHIASRDSTEGDADRA